MSVFDSDRARDSLAGLMEEFRQGGRDHPTLRHFLVKAPKEREPGPCEHFPRSSILSSEDRHDVAEFHLDAEMPQTHYYVGIDPREAGSDLATFRRLAARTARIVDGWPSASTELPILPVRFGRRDAAEAWMTLVHRLAWLNIPSQALKATPTTPASSWWDGYPQEDPADLLIASIPESVSAAEIPPDCRVSSLPDVSVFEACAWAIKLLDEVLRQPGRFAGYCRNPAEDALIRLLGEIIEHDQDCRRQVADDVPREGWELGERTYSAISSEIVRCADEIRGWPHRAGLEWIETLAEAAINLSVAYHEFKQETSGEVKTLAWLPHPDSMAPFVQARARLLEGPSDDELAASSTIQPDGVSASGGETSPVVSDEGSQLPPIPIWNESERSFKYGSNNRNFREDAKNVILLFGAFQRAGWTREIPSPFSGDDEKLRETIKYLKKWSKYTGIRFSRINRKVCWSALPS